MRCGEVHNVGYWHICDIDAALFNVRFIALFGHQRIARSCRRMTHSGHTGDANNTYRTMKSIVSLSDR
jgi:hypothetical protein